LTREKQCDEDDQDDTDDADATVAESVAVAAETAAKAPKQENNEDDNQDGSERHVLSPMAGLKRALDIFVTQNAESLRLDGNAALANIDLDAGYFVVPGRGGYDERSDDEVDNVAIRIRVGFVQVSEARVLRSVWPQLVIHVWRNDQLFRPSSFCLLDCSWQSAHFALSLAHFSFAASHCALVQVSICVAVEGFDESGADTSGDDLVAGGDSEICATTALEFMIGARTTAVR
jgi:hypothetical protein